MMLTNIYEVDYVFVFENYILCRFLKMNFFNERSMKFINTLFFLYCYVTN